MSMDLFRALTGAEKDELARFLDKTPGAMPFPKAQGFLTAVGSAPSMIMPSDWQPAVLGAPEFESMEDAQRILSCLMRMYNQLLSDADEGRTTLPDTEAIASWCEGYLEAMRMDDVWVSDEESIQRIFPIIVLSGMIDLDLERSEEERRQLVLESRAHLPTTVLEVHRYWKEWRGAAMASPVQAATAKVGRNDKCPCGSGLKYKKCCMRQSAPAPPSSPAPEPSSPSRIFTLRATLHKSNPEIWRRFSIPDDYTLGDLHAVLQSGMGWSDSHLHEFEVGSQTFGMGDEDAPPEQLGEDTVLLSEIFKRPGSKVRYLYDFGDGWKLDVELEGEEDPTPGEQYPRYIEGQRHGPPDDVGGVWRYNKLVESFGNPKAWRAAGFDDETLEWLGPDFDPTRFDLDEVHEGLLMYFPIAPAGKA
jgi:yecA family protein